ncbi:MAG: hypothetical protein V2A71_03935 [Candidatus Eisenbacteria bacterium]
MRFGGNSSILVCITIVLALLFALPSPCSAAIDWSLGADAGRKPSKIQITAIDRGNAYGIWAEVISGSFGVSVGFVESLYERRYNFEEVALVLEIANAAKAEPGEVAELKRKGMGWGAIAKQMGVHPASLERAKGNESLFRRYVLSRALAEYYGIPDREVLVLMNEKGYGFDEIVLAVNVCAYSAAPFREVVSARQKGARWRAVAEKFKISPARLGSPPDEIVSAHAKKAKGQGDGGKASSSGKKKPKKSCVETCPNPCR